jgi:hypothetical protein
MKYPAVASAKDEELLLAADWAVASNPAFSVSCVDMQAE